jgi:hypothetical protein
MNFEDFSPNASDAGEEDEFNLAEAAVSQEFISPEEAAARSRFEIEELTRSLDLSRDREAKLAHEIEELRRENEIEARVFQTPRRYNPLYQRNLGNISGLCWQLTVGFLSAYLSISVTISRGVGGCAQVYVDGAT